MPRPPRTGKSSAPTEGKKNQYEIWAEFTDHVAKLISNEAVRLKNLAQHLAPGESNYTIGDFLTDQMKNASRLMEAYNDASKK